MLDLKSRKEKQAQERFEFSPAEFNKVCDSNIHSQLFYQSPINQYNKRLRSCNMFIFEALRAINEWEDHDNQRERERESRMVVKMKLSGADLGNGKLDHQFFLCIHFDLRNCTVSISSYLGHL